MRRAGINLYKMHNEVIRGRKERGEFFGFVIAKSASFSFIYSDMESISVQNMYAMQSCRYNQVIHMNYNPVKDLATMYSGEVHEANVQFHPEMTVRSPNVVFQKLDYEDQTHL